MQFERDIFISYAHIDNESVIADQPGWITEFHRALKVMLSQKMGGEPKIWRDLKLQGNQVFDKEIVDQFSNAAIMISILSPRYVTSDWCKKEVSEFYELCSRKNEFIINNKARVFKVIKSPINLEVQPDYIKNMIGYEFYETDPTSGNKKEFYPFLEQSAKNNYYLRLSDLVQHISDFLLELKTIDAGSTALPVPVDPGKQVAQIFLSETSSDSREMRDNIKRELESHNYKVLPQSQLPLDESMLKKEVLKCLSECQFSIHLIGSKYGIIPEGTEKSIIELQAEIAASVAGSGKLDQLIWVPKNVDITEEKQKRFLKDLNEGNSALLKTAELITEPIEVFKEVIFDKIAAMEKKKNATEAQTKEVSDKMVYIICAIEDRELVKPVRQFFFENGIETMLPIFDADADETQIREDHIDNLTHCNGAIVFYGNGTEAWFRGKIKDFDKYGNNRDQPFSFRSVYMAPPSTESKTFFLKPGWDVINGISEFAGPEFKKLLSKL